MADPFTPKFVDLVRNTVTTVGTGNFTLGPAVNGYTGFAQALQVGDSFYYSAIGVDKPAEREVGRGTLLTGGAINRDPISGTKTNFTSGNKSIALIAAAEWFTAIQAGGGARAFATKALLAAAPASGSALLTAPGGEGLFAFDPSNLASRVAADVRQAIHVAPASDPSGASGAWVRRHGGPIEVTWFGAKGDGTADDTAAIQAALNYLGNTSGGSLHLAGGTYKITSALTVFPKTIIRGDGRWTTKITSAHAGGGGSSAGDALHNGSALVSAAPINASTPVFIGIEDIGLENANSANVGAGYYDTCGTYIHLTNVRVVGFKYGVVLDQSELVDIDLCGFESQADGGAGVWLVNGADLTAGASSQFTNRISVKRCQINQGTATYCVLDDGGAAHVFEDNNYNGGLNAIRACGVAGGAVRGGEFESQTGHIIELCSTTLAGAGAGGNFMSIDAGVYAATTGHASINCNAGAGTLSVGGSATFAGGGGTAAITGASNLYRLWLGATANVTGAPLFSGTPANLNDTTASSSFPDGDKGDVVVGGSGAVMTVESATPAGGSFSVTGLVDASSTIVARNGAIQSDAPAGNAAYFRMSQAGAIKAYIALGGDAKTLFWNAADAAGAHNFQVAGVTKVSIDASGNLAAVGTLAATNLSGTNSGDETAATVTAKLNAFTGDVTKTAGGTALTIANGAVSYAKIQNAAASRLLGNPTGSAATPSEVSLAGGLSFSGTTLTVGALTPTSIATAGTITSSGGGLGYATGAGGTITQATNKSTGVTLNKLCGQITTSAGALAAGASAAFTVTNSQVAGTDTIDLVLASGNVTAGTYNYQVDKVSAGSFAVWLKNISAGSLSEALVFNFSVKKAVNA